MTERDDNLENFIKVKPFVGLDFKDFVVFDPLVKTLLGTSKSLDTALREIDYTHHLHDPYLIESITDYLRIEHGVVFCLNKWIKKNGHS